MIYKKSPRYNAIGDITMLNIIKYLEEQLIPIGLIFLLLLSIRDLSVIERISNNKRLKILAYIVIAIYYFEILIKIVKIAIN